LWNIFKVWMIFAVGKVYPAKEKAGPLPCLKILGNPNSAVLYCGAAGDVMGRGWSSRDLDLSLNLFQRPGHFARTLRDQPDRMLLPN
jgi:hypothetical protein